MKRRAVFIVLILLVLLACYPFFKKSSTKKGLWMQGNGKIKVLSTTAIVGDLVERIGGDGIDHLILMKGETDPHSYELVKGDAELIQRADLIFSNGLKLEHGASLVYALKKHPHHVPLADLFIKKQGEVILFRGQVDPHVWMDVSLWAQLIPLVEEKLSLAAPDLAPIFHDNAERVKREFQALHEEVFLEIQSIPLQNRYLVTSHDAFQYFARRYLVDLKAPDLWLTRISAPEGLAPDGQLSIKNIEEVLIFLKEHKIHVIFPESSVSRDSIKKIIEVSRKKGIFVSLVKEPLYSDTLGGKNSGASDYPSMMRSNAHVISSHLTTQE